MMRLVDESRGFLTTVGGYTYIGVVTKEGFRPLNEPELAHRYTGFGDA